MTTIDVVTIFPAMIDAVLTEGVVGRARTKGLVVGKARDLRDFTTGTSADARGSGAVQPHDASRGAVRAVRGD